MWIINFFQNNWLGECLSQYFHLQSSNVIIYRVGPKITSFPKTEKIENFLGKHDLP